MCCITQKRPSKISGSKFHTDGLPPVQDFLSLRYLEHKTKMARNCEKKLIGLNRLWLAKQQKGNYLYVLFYFFLLTFFIKQSIHNPFHDV